MVRRKDGSLEFKGRLHDPVDGDVFLGVIDGSQSPFGPDDTRSLERRRADGSRTSSSGAQRPRRGVAAGAGDEQPGSDDDALIPAPRRPEP